MAEIAQVIAVNVAAPRRAGFRGTISVPVDTTVTPTSGPMANLAAGIGQHELVYLTAGNGIAGLSTAGTSNANAAKCVGVSKEQYPRQIAQDVFAPDPFSSPAGAQPYIDVYEDGDFLFNTTAGDSYNPYDTLYLGADGRTVSKTVSGSPVAQVSPDQRPSNALKYMAQPPVYPIAGGTGVQIYIRIQPALTGAK